MASKGPEDQQPTATAIVALITLVIVVAGAAVMIINPDALNFQEYISALALLGVGAGALGIGRGIQSAGRDGATAQVVEPVEKAVLRERRPGTMTVDPEEPPI